MTDPDLQVAAAYQQRCKTLLAALTDQSSLPLPHVLYLESVTSTMDVARTLLATHLDAPGERLSGRIQEVQGAPVESPLIVAARTQTAGRGRRGREWLSPPDAGVWVTTSFICRRPVTSLQGFSLAVGVASIEVLRKLSSAILLKWPNDIIVKNEGVAGWKKLGGILIELADRGTDSTVVHTGVGLNVQPSPSVSDMQGISLLELGAPYASSQLPELAASLAHAVLIAAHRVLSHGIAPLIPEYLRVAGLVGERVTVHVQSREIAGEFHGIADDGAMILRAPNGELLHFYEGEVSLRGK